MSRLVAFVGPGIDIEACCCNNLIVNRPHPLQVAFQMPLKRYVPCMTNEVMTCQTCMQADDYGARSTGAQ